MAADVARHGRLRPEIAEACAWHADRLRELVGQHAALAKLEAEHRPGPADRERSAAKTRRDAASRAQPRGLRA